VRTHSVAADGADEPEGKNQGQTLSASRERSDPVFAIRVIRAIRGYRSVVRKALDIAVNGNQEYCHSQHPLFWWCLLIACATP
jgi:hypothetical protein